MPKMKIEARDFADFIEKYDPFGFKDKDGSFMCFDTYEKAYLELFERIYKAGPKMVDAVLFVCDNLGMRIADAQRFVALWKPVCGQSEDEFFFSWTNEDGCLYTNLERFARGMHLVTETKFNKDMFLSAVEKFKIKLIKNSSL